MDNRWSSGLGGRQACLPNPCLFINHSDMLTGRNLFSNHSGVYMYNNKVRWVRDPYMSIYIRVHANFVTNELWRFRVCLGRL